MSSRYYCYNCQRTVSLRDTDLRCGICGSEFIEQVANASNTTGTVPFRSPFDLMFQPPPNISQSQASSQTNNNTTAPSSNQSTSTGASGDGPPSGARPNTNTNNTYRPLINLLDRLPFIGRSQQPAPARSRSEGNSPSQATNEPRIPPPPNVPAPDIPPQNAGNGAPPPDDIRNDPARIIEDMINQLFGAEGTLNLGPGVQVRFQISGAPAGERMHGQMGDYVFGNMDQLLEQLMNQHPGHAQRGISEENLSRLPMVQVNQEHVDNQTQCPTCFDVFALDEEVAQLNCTHIFHRDCVVPWLKQQPTCPMCRKEVKASEWPQRPSSTSPDVPLSAPPGMIDTDDLD